MANRVAMEEVFALCFQGHALNDALNHVMVDRDLFREPPGGEAQAGQD